MAFLAKSPPPCATSRILSMIAKSFSSSTMIFFVNGTLPLSRITDSKVSSSPKISILFRSFFKPPGDRFGDHPRNVASQLGDLPDKTGTEVGILVVGHEEDGLDLRGHFAVGQRHLELVIKIGDRPQAANNGPGFFLPGIVDQQSVKTVDLDVLET